MPPQRGNAPKPQLPPARQVLAARTVPAEEDARIIPGQTLLKKHGLRQHDPGAGLTAKAGTRAGPAGEDGKEGPKDRASPRAKEEERDPKERDRENGEADGTPSGDVNLAHSHLLEEVMRQIQAAPCGQRMGPVLSDVCFCLHCLSFLSLCLCCFDAKPLGYSYSSFAAIMCHSFACSLQGEG